MLAPEPRSKRTVEGDIGVYMNLKNLLLVIENQYSSDEEAVELVEKIDNLMSIGPLPHNKEQIKLYGELARFACLIAIDRHAGGIKEYFSPYDRKKVAYGKDLTSIKYLIGTGGLLSRNRYGYNAKILIDGMYLFSTLGILVDEYPRESISLACESLGLTAWKEGMN
jgi:uncharacterized protein (TIGR01319 family)